MSCRNARQLAACVRVGNIPSIVERPLGSKADTQTQSTTMGLHGAPFLIYILTYDINVLHMTENIG